MSERDSESGQFTPAEPLTGQAGIEADMGFVPMADTPQDHPEAPSDIMEEVKKLQASRVPEDDPVVEVQYLTPAGERVDPNETVSLDRAATDLEKYHTAEVERERKVDDGELRRYVDAMRAELLEENPDLAQGLGLSKEDIAAAKAAENSAPNEKKSGDNNANINSAAEHSAPESDPYSDIPGLEPATREAMKNPQIRQAVEAEFAKIAEHQQAYQTGLNSAHQFGQAALLALAPELAQVPIERWGEGVNIIAQSDPVRGRQLATMFQNVAALNERQQLIAHHEQAQRHHQFETLRQQYSQQSEKVLGLSNQEKFQMAEELVAYLGEHGVSREQLMAEANTNLLVHHPAFNALAKDALKYRAMQKAAKPHATKNLPPVTRPGTSAVQRSGGNEATISSLKAKVANSTGHAAIRAAAQLQRAMRKG
jgi:hypothetical protein